MPMPVVHIRDMRMVVHQRHVGVRVRVRLDDAPVHSSCHLGAMRVLVVLIVHVPVLVLQRRVRVRVSVPRPREQPHAAEQPTRRC